jgi:REP element-mobilizing transposase RayT
MVSRPLRIHVPGMLYHVVARGNDKQCIYTDDADCRSFLQLLADTLPRFDARCVFYCLLWNHYHLLMKAGCYPISRLMQQLNSTYCQRFNRRHRRVGHVLQGRFGSRIVEDGAYARAVLRYIALNPVMARLAVDPRDWRWSSYRSAVDVSESPGFLCLEEVWAAFGTSDPAIGRTRLSDFVRAGLQEVFLNPLLHGSEQLASVVAPLLKPHENTREHVYAQRYAARPPIGVLFDGRSTQAELDEAARIAFAEYAYTLDEISRVLARHPSVVCRWIQRAKRRRQIGQASLAEDNPAKNKL